MVETLPDLAGILEQLAAATTPAELRALHSRLGFAIKTKRKLARKDLGSLAQTYQESMRIWDEEKADGVSLADRQQHLKQSLCAAWPETQLRTYLCERCSDTGWDAKLCTKATPCGRRQCPPGHDYVEPCVCPKGEARQQQLHPTTTSADFQQAGKRKGFTKVGR